jgi:hypothetical protein
MNRIGGVCFSTIQEAFVKPYVSTLSAGIFGTILVTVGSLIVATQLLERSVLTQNHGSSRAELHFLNLIQKPRIGEFLGKKILFVIHADRLCFSV